MSDIENVMSKHLVKRHTEAQDKITAARKAIREAVNASLEVAELLNKAKSHKKSSIHDWICSTTNIKGDESRAYLTCRHVKQTRDVAEDKRCLQLLGILKKAPARTKTKVTPSKPSPAMVANTASEKILKALELRPISKMTPGERAVLKMNLERVARVFVNLSK